MGLLLTISTAGRGRHGRTSATAGGDHVGCHRDIHRVLELRYNLPGCCCSLPPGLQNPLRAGQDASMGLAGEPGLPPPGSTPLFMSRHAGKCFFRADRFHLRPRKACPSQLEAAKSTASCKAWACSTIWPGCRQDLPPPHGEPAQVAFSHPNRAGPSLPWLSLTCKTGSLGVSTWSCCFPSRPTDGRLEAPDTASKQVQKGALHGPLRPPDHEFAYNVQLLDPLPALLSGAHKKARRTMDFPHDPAQACPGNRLPLHQWGQRHQGPV